MLTAKYTGRQIWGKLRNGTGRCLAKSFNCGDESPIQTGQTTVNESNNEHGKFGGFCVSLEPLLSLSYSLPHCSL